ncbi:DUF397 domain-containing protein [Actinomadura sp. 3N508]|uniref:DUF397 domain-containing protein n=1 Tax=Actinomadura sp. 3N508 TaxID=3375153 RepID=UPI0037A49B42
MSLRNDLSKASWRKSSRSSPNGNDCVEIASLPGLVAIRDSKNPHGPKLLLTPNTWRHLAKRVTTGELDV